MKFSVLYRAALLLLFAVAGLKVQAAAYDAVVGQDGSEQYNTVQAAINAAPEGSTKPYRIFIKKGRYTQQLIIPAGKNFLELIGEDPANTILVYGDGKAGTPAVIINADDCMLKNLTLVNTQGAIGDGPQSLAVRTNGDRLVFFNCRFISGQDTVLISKPATRVYFSRCYIDGNTDFIYGAAVGLFDDCVVYARDRVDGYHGGYITAANTPVGQPYGLVFRNCLIPNNHGITVYTLGRPWQNDATVISKGRSRAENKVVFINTKMSSIIVPEGWSIWNEGTVTSVITYAEYNSQTLAGKPVDVSHRLGWTKQLDAATAAPYLKNENLFGNWDPFKTWTDLPEQSTVNLLGLQNLIARDNGDKILLQFNTCRPASNATFTLYRSDDNKASFKKIDQLRTGKDTIVAYQFKDRTPASGQHRYYVVSAVQDKKTVYTDTLEVAADMLKPLKPMPKNN